MNLPYVIETLYLGNFPSLETLNWICVSLARYHQSLGRKRLWVRPHTVKPIENDTTLIRIKPPIPFIILCVDSVRTVLEYHQSFAPFTSVLIAAKLYYRFTLAPVSTDPCTSVSYITIKICTLCKTLRYGMLEQGLICTPEVEFVHGHNS